MDNPFKSPAILSLCTGMRGLERGIERALNGFNFNDCDIRTGTIQQVQDRLRIAAYVEIEAFVIENMVRQMEQGVLAPAPVWSNLKTFPSQQFHGKIHGITGGYPCQPFSVAGSRKGTEDPRHLWPYIKTMVGAIRPVWCFFENVRGHLNLGFEQVYNDLQELGYTVHFGIFSAEEVGAPHRRERLFIIAVANSSSGGNIRGLREVVDKNEGIKTCEESGENKCIKSINAGSEMDNSSSNGLKQIDEVCTRRDSTELASEELANANSSGSWEDTKRSKLRSDSIEQSSSDSGRTNQGEEREKPIERWPARPGQPQHKWESPRVESSMGFTIDGYNFREDLLRMQEMELSNKRQN